MDKIIKYIKQFHYQYSKRYKNLSHKINENRKRILFQYDQNGNLIEEINQFDRTKTTIQYDQNGNRVTFFKVSRNEKIKDAIYWKYIDNLLISRTRMEWGQVESINKYYYNSQRRKVIEEVFDGRHKLIRSEEHQYLEDGKIVKITLRDSMLRKVSVFENHYTDDIVTKVIEKSPSNKITEITEYKYNDCKKVTSYQSLNFKDYRSAFILSKYSENGHLLWSRYRMGNSNFEQTYTRNEKGDPLSYLVIKYHDNSIDFSIYEYEFDPYGNWLKKQKTTSDGKIEYWEREIEYF